MKIGLVTIYQVPNYGSVLQAFATQYLLEHMGVECCIINYKYPNEWHWQHGAQRPHKLRTLVRKLYPSKKTKVLENFRKGYFHFTKRFNSLEELEANDWNDFDAFVVGSDQVWNARFVLGDSVFMLSFAPEGKARYSIASSFALKSLPNHFRDKYSRELSLFSALSVRELNGVGIINDELKIDKSVYIILDPTLLLSKGDWMKAIPRSKLKKTRPYILFYMWSYAFEPRPYIFEVVKYFQQKMNCDVIALEGYAKPENANGLVMENRCSSTIPEFIDLFSKADLVVTSSFHGTAFALNFGNPLVSVIPDYVGDDRQSSLLNSVNCLQCGIKIGSKIEEINPFYDVAKEQKKLVNMRKSNIDWIKNNFLKTND